MTLTSAAGTDAQTVCQGVGIAPIKYTIAGAATGVTLTGALPTGVTGTLTAGVYTISGTPTVSGPFTYTVTTTGGSCAQITLNGSINVTSLSSPTISCGTTTTTSVQF